MDNQHPSSQAEPKLLSAAEKEALCRDIETTATLFENRECKSRTPAWAYEFGETVKMLREAAAALRAQPTECEPNGPVVITGGTFAGLKGRAVMHDTYRQTLVEDDENGFQRWYPDFWVSLRRD